MLLGAATAGVAGAAASVAGLSEAFEKRPEAAEAAAAEPIVVHLQDLRSGRLEVFAGERRIEIRDRDLAARLAKAARQG